MKKQKNEDVKNDSSDVVVEIRLNNDFFFFIFFGLIGHSNNRQCASVWPRRAYIHTSVH